MATPAWKKEKECGNSEVISWLLYIIEGLVAGRGKVLFDVLKQRELFFVAQQQLFDVLRELVDVVGRCL